MKESKATLLKSDLDYVEKRIKILKSVLSMELNDESFNDVDIQSIAMDFLSTLTSTAKRIKKEHDIM